MKKTLLIIVCILLTIPSFAQKRGGGEVTLPQLDSQVLKKYEQYSPKLQAVIDDYNATVDSVKKSKLEDQYKKLEMQCNADLLSIYGKNLNVEGVTGRLFALRTTMSKEQLERIYKRLSADKKQNDPYAKSIRAHINTRQIELGDTLGQFRAITSSGHPFLYEEFKNEKDLLLIFGEPSSLPVDARLILQITYRDLDLSQLEIVSVFTDQTDKLQFQALANGSGIEWLKISDLRGEHSPLSIAFGVASTPMCFYVSRGGAVEYISVGITDLLIERIKLKCYKK